MFLRAALATQDKVHCCVLAGLNFFSLNNFSLLPPVLFCMHRRGYGTRMRKPNIPPPPAFFPSISLTTEIARGTSFDLFL
eukprot:gene980-575_t